VDSKLVSTRALSFLVLALARASEEGASRKDLLELVRWSIQKLGFTSRWTTWNTCTRRGASTTAKRFLGTALNIKTLLEIQRRQN
jgi:fatty acid-binding protein DegV